MRLQLNNTYIILSIIILGIILLWFFYGTKEGYDNLESNNSDIYTDSSGNTATVTSDSINATSSNGSGTILKVTDDPNVYADSLGNTAFIIESSSGAKTLTIKNDQGDVKIYTNHENKSKQTYDNYNHYDKTSYPLIYYGPNGNTARVIKTPNDNSLVITNNDGSTHIYYIDKYDKNVYVGKNGAKATIIVTSNGKKAIEINDGKGNIIVFYQDKNYYKTNNNSFVPLRSKLDFGSYFGGSENEEGAALEMSTLPKGIPKWMIPKGEEDLYVLKSQIVPPVCPLPPPTICPKQKNKSNNNNSNNGTNGELDDDFDVTKCPACPPCARCQEPSFTCEKVPNYNAFSANGGPLPAYDDWSSFK